LRKIAKRGHFFHESSLAMVPAFQPWCYSLIAIGYVAQFFTQRRWFSFSLICYVIHLRTRILHKQQTPMTERELIKLEATIRNKMEDIRKQRVSLKDSGIGGLMNSLKKVDEALYEKIMPEYKKMVTDYNIFK
jgi:hypothetical protein